jgi:hypothetical protein
MQPFLQTTGVLLLLLTTVASWAGSSALMAPPAQNMRPAGCHGHSMPVRSPAPVSHQCCIAGHNTAIPTSLFSVDTVLAFSGPSSSHEQLSPAARFGDTGSTLPPLTWKSPGSVSLRI